MSEEIKISNEPIDIETLMKALDTTYWTIQSYCKHHNVPVTHVGRKKYIRLGDILEMPVKITVRRLLMLLNMGRTSHQGDVKTFEQEEVDRTFRRLVGEIEPTDQQPMSS